MKPRILGIFAHPDDECYCAGGTFAKYAAAGAAIKVIAATKGDAGQIRDASVATRQTLGAVRERELWAACQRLGVGQVECWDYGDGTLHSVDMERLTADALAAMRDFQPDIVITFGPDGGYGHPDHIAIGHATTRAFQQRLDANENAGKLYHAYFPQSEQLFSEKLVQWLVNFEDYYQGSLDFVLAITLLAEEIAMLNFASDHLEVKWFPQGFYIIEQGEPADKLYLMLSGKAIVAQDDEHGNQHVVNEIHPGRFFGEEGLARRQRRNAHVIAAASTTALVFSASAPTKFAGRGEGAQFLTSGDEGQPLVESGGATTRINVRDLTRQKIEAISQHRTQFPLTPDMLPLDILQDLFGTEYFVRVYPPIALAETL